MRRWWLIVLLEGCGRAGLVDGDAGALVTRPDGSTDAGGADAGTQGIDSGLDAGADGGRWCAQAAGACLANGWDDAPGRCCFSRMTCKTLDLDGGRPGFCEY